MSTVPATIAANTSPGRSPVSDIAGDIVGTEGPLESIEFSPVASVTWQKELADAVRSSIELLTLLGFMDSAGARVESSSNDPPMKSEVDFPVFVTRSFLERIRPGDPHDPLLRQVLPITAELQQLPGFFSDAVGDHDARRAPGLLQKYSGRALMIATGACAIHCRYCFRREYPYRDDPRSMDDWEPAFQELEADQTLSEVILSGGDPLMLTDMRLEAICQRISQIPHVERIRIHTRLPIVLPNRVTSGLLELLRQLRPQVIFVVHANHAQEIDQTCAAALRKILQCGIPVLNQTVLLKQINDDADVLEELFRRLINIGVMPYYLHQLDRVTGTAHFEVPVEVGQSLIRELARRLPGYAVPRYVQEIPGQPHKTLI